MKRCLLVVNVAKVNGPLEPADIPQFILKALPVFHELFEEVIVASINEALWRLLDRKEKFDTIVTQTVFKSETEDDRMRVGASSLIWKTGNKTGSSVRIIASYLVTTHFLKVPDALEENEFVPAILLKKCIRTEAWGANRALEFEEKEWRELLL